MIIKSRKKKWIHVCQGEHTKIEYQYVRNLDKREVIVRLVDVGGIQVRLKGIQAVRI
jgi:hypothetical protein